MLCSRGERRVSVWVLMSSFGLGVGVLGCTCGAATPSSGPAASGSAATASLDPELAARVLARVGDRTITLADFSQALERMDRFERLRYQTPERRKLLLDEMIDTELLAREAERRGLDKRPETQAALDQLMRDEVLRELRRSQPPLEELPAGEVQAYYAAHPDEFRDPERRRIAVVVVGARDLARKLAAELGAADAAAWSEAVRVHSVRQDVEVPAGSPEVARPPLTLAGDLGLVSAPGELRGNNPQVPEALRAAVFALQDVGAVTPEPVEIDGQFYVVRLVAKLPARIRSLSEADTMVRVRVLAERIGRAEAALNDRLREQFPVVINEEGLAKLRATLALEAASAATPGSVHP
jgi:PPIC-type PPIASE domain